MNAVNKDIRKEKADSTAAPINLKKHTRVVTYTTDLAQFRLLTWNRPVCEKNVKSKQKALREQGMVSEYPIIVNDAGYVFDGQHRLEAARREGMGVWYTVHPDLNENEPSSVSKIRDAATKCVPWSTADILHSLSIQGDKGATWILNYCQEHRITPAGATNFILGSGFCRGGLVSRPLKLTEEHKSKALFFASCLRDFESVIPESVTSQQFLAALKMVINSSHKYSRDRMRSKLNTAAASFLTKCVDKRQWVQKLQDTYNYKVSKSDKVAFLDPK